MTKNLDERTAVLIVRLWIEPGHEDGIRARITEVPDSSAPQHSVAVTNSAKGICDAIEHWVGAFAHPVDSMNPSGG